MRSDLLDRILAARAAKRAVVLATDLATGAQELVYPHDGQSDGEPTDEALLSAAREAQRADRSGTVDGAGLRLAGRTPEGPVFLNVINPPLRMVVVGAVHIAQALAPMAALAGFEVTIIDPRRSFATAERFPGVALSSEWPDEAMAALEPDGRTAVVTLTHDPKLDDPALAAALGSEAFYIGALGSRRTHAARLERLARAGFRAEETARIHGPVGLDLGARSPAEIAVSILAEVVSRLRKGDAP